MPNAVTVERRSESGTVSFSSTLSASLISVSVEGARSAEPPSWSEKVVPSAPGWACPQAARAVGSSSAWAASPAAGPASHRPAGPGGVLLDLLVQVFGCHRQVLAAGNLQRPLDRAAVGVLLSGATDAGCPQVGVAHDRLLQLLVADDVRDRAKDGAHHRGGERDRVPGCARAIVGLPGAIFSPWMNVSGSVLANYWKRKP